MEVVLQSLNQKLQEAIAEKPDHNVKQHYLEFLNNICDGKTVTTKCPDFSNGKPPWVNVLHALFITEVDIVDLWPNCRNVINSHYALVYQSELHFSVH